MALIVWFLWILMWGLAGYFTVGAIVMHIQKKRMEKAMAAYWQHQRLMMKHTEKTNGTQFSLNPFADLSKKDV